MSQQDARIRYLAWEGCDNARDLGGLPTTNGGHTRSGALIRSDSLFDLTAEGQAALRDHGVRTVVDVRLEHELETHPDPFAAHDGPGDVPRYVNVPMHDLQTGEAIDAANSTADAYIVILERGKDLIARIIKAIAAGLEDGGVLVHCQGGRDRTGIIVALLLSLAGVPRDVIAEDYALSEVMLEPLYLKWVEDQIRATGRHPGKPRYMQSRPETMYAVLDYLDRAYAGVEGYLAASGVTPAEMEQIRKHLITTDGGARS